MARLEGGNGSYYLDVSVDVLEDLRILQRLATQRGEGKAFAASFRRIRKALVSNPMKAGEPLYFLPALRLQMRTLVVAPLAIDFAVDQERHITYIQGAKLLSPSDQ